MNHASIKMIAANFICGSLGSAHYRHQSRGPARGRKLGPEPRSQNSLTRPILLKCFVFKHFYANHGSGTRFFTKSMKRRAPTAVARLVVAELLASETPERCRSTFPDKVCFTPHVSVDLVDFMFRGC